MTAVDDVTERLRELSSESGMMGAILIAIAAFVVIAFIVALIGLAGALVGGGVVLVMNALLGTAFNPAFGALIGAIVAIASNF